MTKEKKHNFKFNSAPTQNWKDLEDLHNSIKDGVCELVLEIQKHLLFLSLDPYFKDDPQVKLFQKCFLEDFSSFTEKLLDIQKKYENKKGMLKEDEFALYLTLAGEYEQLSALITDVLFKSATEIQDKVMQLISIKETEDKQKKSEEEVKNVG